MTTSVAATAPPDRDSAPYRWRWLAFAAVLAADVMDLLDSTITTIAAPAIRADLGGKLSTIQWISAGYTLAFAVLLITGGRLGDIAGRRRMFLVGAAGFTLGSTLCAVAPTPGLLIASRVLQGAFGALMIPQGFGITKAIFPPKELGTAFGMFGPIMGLCAVGGPVLAGWLVDLDLAGVGWRLIFLINLPIGLAILALAARSMPRDERAADRPRLDVPGMLLVTAASVLLIYPLVQGRELGWPLWTYLMMAASAPVLAVFAAHQRRRRGADPLVEPALFGRRAFTAGVGVVTVFFAAMIGLSLLLSLYLQLGLGFTPLRAGLAMIPWALGIAAGATLSGAFLGAKLGRRTVHLGLLVLIAGMVGLAYTINHYAATVTVWHLVPATLACGIGSGFALPLLFNIILAGVTDAEVGSASGVLNALQQFGGAVGVALLGTLLFSRVDHYHGDFPAAAPSVILLSVGLTVLAFFLAFFLPHQPRPEE